MKKTVYPILIYYDPGDKVPYYVEVPDFDRGTQGTGFAEALEMAEDLINELIVTYQDQNMEIPEPSRAEDLRPDEGAVVSWVVADPDEYRKKTDNRAATLEQELRGRKVKCMVVGIIDPRHVECELLELI